jgi:PhzF family phenazine biosynthesis protein
MTIYVVDAFTSEPFRGNPAGVCILEEERSDSWKQGLARELNHPETAFIRPNGRGYELRWFTPTVEVPLCGHATLAGAHILSTVHGIRGSIDFQTRYSGTLTATVSDDSIWLDFPALLGEPLTGAHDGPPAAGLSADYQAVETIEGLLGSEPEELFVHRGAQENFYLARLKNPAAVRELEVDTGALLAGGVGQLIVTARDDDGDYDFISRFFAPGFGIDEDPVTGAAHCVLAPYWSRYLGERPFRAYQASQRGGELRCEFRDGRVRLGGEAVTVLEATLFA